MPSKNFEKCQKHRERQFASKNASSKTKKQLPLSKEQKFGVKRFTLVLLRETCVGQSAIFTKTAENLRSVKRKSGENVGVP